MIKLNPPPHKQRQYGIPSEPLRWRRFELGRIKIKQQNKTARVSPAVTCECTRKRTANAGK